MIICVPSARKRHYAVIFIQFVDHLQRSEIIGFEVPIQPALGVSPIFEVLPAVDEVKSHERYHDHRRDWPSTYSAIFDSAEVQYVGIGFFENFGSDNPSDDDQGFHTD